MSLYPPDLAPPFFFDGIELKQKKKIWKKKKRVRNIFEKKWKKRHPFVMGIETESMTSQKLRLCRSRDWGWGEDLSLVLLLLTGDKKDRRGFRWRRHFVGAGALRGGVWVMFYYNCSLCCREKELGRRRELKYEQRSILLPYSSRGISAESFPFFFLRPLQDLTGRLGIHQRTGWRGWLLSRRRRERETERKAGLHS